MDGPVTPDQGSGALESNAEREMLDFLASASMRYRRPRRGDLVEGIVVDIGRDAIVVDIGTKTEALIPAQEAGSVDRDLSSVVSLGEEIVARVVDPDDGEGRTVLSLARAQADRGWRVVQEMFTEGTTVEARVVEVNRGGLVVGVHGLRGFVPLSQLVGSRPAGAGEESVEAMLEARRGETLTLKILEFNRRRNRLILSERAAEHERRLQERDRLLAELQEGELRPGRVSSLCDFGAFVDLGGADGLVHISEISWAPVGHAREVVQVGDEVQVVVLAVDREKKKISLSLKRAQPEPWATVPERYHVGQIVQARVKKLAAFGAFVEIEPGVEGLIHISELSDQRIAHPKSVVHEGEPLAAKILRIEPERHRLGLSLRQAQEELEAAEWQGAPVAYGPATQTIGEALGSVADSLSLAEALLPEEEELEDEDAESTSEEAAPVQTGAGSS